MARGRLSLFQSAVLDEFFAHERGFLLLAWLLSQWELPVHLKVPAGYDLEQLRRFKDELAERMAIAAHPSA